MREVALLWFTCSFLRNLPCSSTKDAGAAPAARTAGVQACQVRDMLLPFYSADAAAAPAAVELQH